MTGYEHDVRKHFDLLATKIIRCWRPGDVLILPSAEGTLEATVVAEHADFQTFLAAIPDGQVIRVPGMPFPSVVSRSGSFGRSQMDYLNRTPSTPATSWVMGGKYGGFSQHHGRKGGGRGKFNKR